MTSKGNENMSEDNSIKRRSICRVKAPNYNGVRWLKRMADVDERGRIVAYDFDPDQPMIFGNRNRIFGKDGPKDEGFIGIWDWTAIPSLSSSYKDHIESYYDSSESPIEIIEISKAYSVEDLVSCLKSGVTTIPSCERVMFVHKPIHEKYGAVLCEKEMLEVSNTYVTLKSEVASLNVYYFDGQSIFTTKFINFYHFLNVGEPDQVILTKPHSDIVKEIILRRASWSVAKQNGLSKRDWKMFKDFIGNLSDESIYQEIAGLCSCSKADAKKYLEDFISDADSKINEGDIDSEILSNLVEKNDRLRLVCEKLVKENWEANNQEKIKEKLEELEHVAKELAEQIDKRDAIEKGIEKEKKKLEKIIEDVSHYETLCNSVKSKVRDKIDEARKDVAEFISQLAMLSPVNSMANPVHTSTEEFNITYTTGDECFDGEIETFTDAIDSIVDELGESGVEGHYISSLAIYMFSAYTNHAHLLLAGPNGESIANAFSIGLFGKYAAVFDCNQKYDKKAIDIMMSSDDEVVIIKNPLCAEWRDAIMNLLIGNSKFLILLNPFSEDLSIEPKGLFNYVLPLFTETIINDSVRDKFIGKKQATSYEKYERRKEKPMYRDFLKKLNTTPLLTNRIQRVLTDMHYLDKEADNTVDYLYVFFPYAYITGMGSVFVEKIREDNKIDSEKADYMCKCFGGIE